MSGIGYPPAPVSSLMHGPAVAARKTAVAKKPKEKKADVGSAAVKVATDKMKALRCDSREVVMDPNHTPSIDPLVDLMGLRPLLGS